MAGIALSSLKKYEALANNEEPLRQMRFDTIEKLVGFYEGRGVQFTTTDENVSVKIQAIYLTWLWNNFTNHMWASEQNIE